jgi:Pectate lyase superfamily protein
MVPASPSPGEAILMLVRSPSTVVPVHASFLVLFVAVFALLCGCGPNLGQRGQEEISSASAELTTAYSELWGQSGERWTPDSRLPDFSFAGYRAGASPMPTPPIVANVKSFGAVGDGVSDDSQAFVDAIAATSSGAISIPAGRYKVTRVLKITKSNIVLRGAGAGTTTLVFPYSLSDVLGGSTGAWSSAGGFLWLAGKDNGAKLANVTGAATRGAKTLTVDTAAGIAVGTTIRLVEFNTDGSLGRHLHADLIDAGPAAPRRLVDFAVRVLAVSGNTLTLERPLPADVRSVWTPQIYGFAPTTQETGVENLSIEFPNVPYAGHLVEKGYNAIYFDGIANSWVKNVTILDADSGILTGGTAGDAIDSGMTRFCTIDNLRLGNQFRGSSGITGHHGIALEGPRDMLITHFNFDKQFMHDLTVDWTASGNVFSSGRGINMNFDHHRYVPYENLFTDIDVGAGDTLWNGSRTQDSGDASGGPVAGARTTVWNIRASAAQLPLPGWPQLNVIGMLRYPTQKGGNVWVEQLDPTALFPSNLHLAQLAFRQGGSSTTPALTSVVVSPSTATVRPSGTQQFVATGHDQFGSPMSLASMTWSANGGGSIDASGLFLASATTGPFVVTATSSGKSGTASVSVSTSSDVTLAAVADAFVRDGSYATTNFGSATGLEIKTHDSSWSRNTYLKFNLTGVPAAINGAKLRLYGNSGGALSVATFSAGSTWTEGSLTWNTQPAVGTSALSTLTVSGTSSRWYEWDLTAYVRAEKSAGATSVSLLVKAIGYSADFASFNSKEAGSGTPQLVVSSAGGGGPTTEPPTVAATAAATPSPTVGTTTSLSVLGTDDGGEGNLTYTWATTGTPPAAVAFSSNSTNAAKNTIATFSAAGTYTFQATIMDAQGLTSVSNVAVAVNRATTSVAVLPASASVASGATQQFTPTAYDQFGTAFSPSPAFTWAVSDARGQISSTGLYTAGSVAGGPFTITGASSGKSGTASATVVGSGGGSSVAIGVLADAFVRDGSYASTNFGTASYSEIKLHDTSWSRISYLKFDLSSLPSSFAQVKLRIYASVNADALTMQAFGVTNASWLESGLTWANQPTISATSLAQLSISSTTAQWYELDITSYAQAEKSAGRSIIALALKGAAYNVAFASFVSKEGGANAPQLVIAL